MTKEERREMDQLKEQIVEMGKEVLRLHGAMGVLVYGLVRDPFSPVMVAEEIHKRMIEDKEVEDGEG